MLYFPLMLRVKLPVVDRIHPQSNNFAMGVEEEATGDSKLNDSTGEKLDLDVVTVTELHFLDQSCCFIPSNKRGCFV